MSAWVLSGGLASASCWSFKPWWRSPAGLCGGGGDLVKGNEGDPLKRPMCFAVSHSVVPAGAELLPPRGLSGVTCGRQFFEGANQAVGYSNVITHFS